MTPWTQQRADDECTINKDGVSKRHLQMYESVLCTGEFLKAPGSIKSIEYLKIPFSTHKSEERLAPLL